MFLVAIFVAIGSVIINGLCDLCGQHEWRRTRVIAGGALGFS